ncbi:MAG: sensor histidine kinase, partial [Nocardioidaceae bacterium]
ARELHDVVSHGLSVVVVQTQAARGALADRGEEHNVARHLDAVESTARDALAEMRRMLGLLQLDGLDAAGGPEPPSQGLGDLEALVDRAGQAGLPVDAELPDHTVRLSPGLELAVYRIVQEALTNVVKHAPGAPTSVEVRPQRGTVEVRVTSAPRRGSPWRPAAANTGHGLVGMRERVLMYGGRLVAAPLPDGRFQVHAVIPVEAGDRSGPMP